MTVTLQKSDAARAGSAGSPDAARAVILSAVSIAVCSLILFQLIRDFWKPNA